MAPEVFRRVCQIRPFQPFIVHMADGRRINVPSPEFLIVPDEGRIIIAHQPGGGRHIVDLLLVTDVEYTD
jgi:hypothetical protein